MFKIKEHEAITKIQELQDEILATREKLGKMIEWLFENRDTPAENKEKPENSSQAVPKCKTCKHADKSKRESLCQYNYTAGTKGCFALRQYL